MLDRPGNINVFMLYAEEDEDLKRELETHLSLLNQKGVIDIWHEGKMIFGRGTDRTYQKYLEKADLILLLISANFLAPNVYGKYEAGLQAAYERQKAGGTQIVPVILRPCVWQLDILSNLEPLPKGGIPVRSRHWDSRDLAFQNIAMGILNIADRLKKKAQSSIPPPLPSQRKKAEINRDDEAQKIIGALLQIIQHQPFETGRLNVLSFVHQSLIKEGQLDNHFEKYKFGKAYEKVHLYKIPIEIKSKKSSGRKSIGVLYDKEEGGGVHLHPDQDSGFGWHKRAGKNFLSEDRWRRKKFPPSAFNMFHIVSVHITT